MLGVLGCEGHCFLGSVVKGLCLFGRFRLVVYGSPSRRIQSEGIESICNNILQKLVARMSENSCRRVFTVNLEGLKTRVNSFPGLD